MSQRGESPLRELCRGVLPAPDPESEHARRERIAGRVLTLQRELTQQRRTRRRSALVSALAALLGGALALVLWLRAAPEQGGRELDLGVRLLSGHAISSQPQGDAPIVPGPLALGAGLLVTRADEGAELLLASETELAVAPASRVGLERRASAGGFEERVRLVTGRVALQVPKLGTRGKVSVETSDALVEVHGTRFSVRVVPRASLEPFTEVEVQEGRVRVRGAAGERMLVAGEHWSSMLPSSMLPSSMPPPAVTPALAPEPAAAPVRRARRAAPVPPNPSDLAAQNRLLEAAELAHKNGLPELALERLSELMRLHPDSEHAHSARVARFRLLRELGREQEAQAAARQYLKSHPRGFARAEVQGWLDKQ
ncbi:MAG: hypothetical protein RL033_1142 [Pseudomonadota bacterium]